MPFRKWSRLVVHLALKKILNNTIDENKVIIDPKFDLKIDPFHHKNGPILQVLETKR